MRQMLCEIHGLSHNSYYFVTQAAKVPKDTQNMQNKEMHNKQSAQEGKLLTSTGQGRSAIGFSGASGCRNALPSSGCVAEARNCSCARAWRRLAQQLSRAAARMTWHHRGTTASSRPKNTMRPQFRLPSSNCIGRKYSQLACHKHTWLVWTRQTMCIAAMCTI